MYKVSFKVNKFITELTSSTLFGALCSALSDYIGPEYIDEIYSGNESLILSDVYKNTSKNIVANFTEENRTFTECEITRKSVDNRFSYTYYMCEDTLFFLVDTTFEREVIESIISIAFTKGIGARKSVGYGQVKLLSIEEIDDDILGAEGSAYMTLSDYIPNEDDSCKGKFTTRIIRGKTIDGVGKEPVYVVNSLSKFLGNPTNHFIGKLVKDDNTGTIISGQSLVLRVDNE